MGPRRFELVVLDGSSKKHKITAYYAGEFEPDVENPIAHAVELLKDAAKAHRIPKENLGLVIDSGSSAFRRIDLPFSDPAKLEQVIKFEIESELPQWNIDDVVIDFHILRESDHGSDLLVTAVPKADVRAALKLCEKAGLEPLEVQLETSAMYNAATSANLCGPEDAQLLVHVGDLATSVVVVDGGKVQEMRVIHIGALTHELSLVGESAGEAGEGAEEDEAPKRAPIDPIEASRRVDQALQRIRRELGRTLSAATTAHPIEAIYVCGIEIPGLIGEPIMDLPVYVLDCFEADGGQPVDGFGQLVAAYGAAVTQLGGGVMKPRLRREELAFTGAWERMEFPLAVAAMLLAMLGAAFFFMEKQKVTRLEESARFWVNSSHNFLVGSRGKPEKATMSPPPDDVLKFVNRFRPSPGEPIDYQSPIENAMGNTLAIVQDHVKRLKADLGDSGAITQPQSAFHASLLVLKVLEENASKWRTSIHKLSADYMEDRNKKDQSLVEVRMDIVFMAENASQATRNYEAFREALSKDHDWFVRLDEKPTKDLVTGEGIIIEGLTVGVNVSRAGDDEKSKPKQ
ncbi:MAG: pilus assembly protein PilM [Planctomycetes bacterium]|mgnify:CR=1 FL=1|nr:pilus assembly protein PilM [Planctomycetota bacterium]